QKFEDIALISFKLPNGCLSQIVVNWLTPFKIREIEIATSEAYYRGDLITQKLTRFKRNNRTGAVSMFDFPISYREPLKQEIESFISYVKSETSSPVSVEEAIENLNVAVQCLNC
ncbi:MAG: gfo/Idh/MocA family oxidoreductase, partial [Candidatus Micrarchaeota archaeon]|nr:gfo/Idh/MocA family oxidoreductase [Candidatus Micrarchaeota archaeon]